MKNKKEKISDLDIKFQELEAEQSKIIDFYVFQFIHDLFFLN
jgi:hypothetical protein